MTEQTQIRTTSNESLSAADTKFSAFVRRSPENERAALSNKIRHATATDADVQGYLWTEQVAASWYSILYGGVMDTSTDDDCGCNGMGETGAP
jgi:hypothetical protein